MNYTLNQLKIFLKIAERGSITKAAEELHLTQPAVSNQLKNLQNQFDIPLTELVGRKIYITDFGKEIAQSAERILNEVSTIDFRTHAFKGQLTGRLKISIVSTGKYVMPYFLSSFMNQHLGIELQMDVTNKEQVIGSITENLVDFSLVSILPAAMQVEKLDLLENKLYLISNNSNKFKNSSYSKNIFKELPLIYRESGSGTRQAMETFIHKHNVPVVKKMELTSNEAVKQAMLAGLGFSIMPLIGIRKELQSGELQIIPVQGLPIKTKWRLIWAKGKNHSPVASAFLNYIKKEKEAIVNNHFKWCEDYS
ncbi:MAG: LysR family transcriptional regulator [Chryseolinea sp.]